eukprot:COSAG05_NODE_5547_length_1145_cov_1.350860_1_plen_262_part_10
MEEGELCFAHDGLTDGGVAAVVREVLSLGEGLTALDLSGNHITDEGAGELAPALASARCLRLVNLGSNPITDRGRLAIFRALAASRRRCNVLLTGAGVRDILLAVKPRAAPASARINSSPSPRRVGSASKAEAVSPQADADDGSPGDGGETCANCGGGSGGGIGGSDSGRDNNDDDDDDDDFDDDIDDDDYCRRYTSPKLVRAAVARAESSLPNAASGRQVFNLPLPMGSVPTTPPRGINVTHNYTVSSPALSGASIATASS